MEEYSDLAQAKSYYPKAEEQLNLVRLKNLFFFKLKS